MDVLSKEIGHRGITANTIIPFAVNHSGIFAEEDSYPELRKSLIDSCLMGRLAEVEDVANIAEFFASDLSSFVNGQYLLVNGGATQLLSPMSLLKKIVPILLLCFLQACGQIGNHQHKTVVQMEYGRISNLKVKTAIEAWQKGDATLWLSLFTTDTQLLDDGHSRDFKKFSTEAIGHERFTSVDKVEDNGMSVYGRFHSDTWSDFKTYFKFYLDAAAKFDKLEIGQASY